MGTLPDLLFIDGNYAISDQKTNHFQIATDYTSPWYYTGNQVPAQTIELLLPHQEQLWSHELLLTNISVSFGKPLTQELIKPVKHTGAGKILKTKAGEC